MSLVLNVFGAVQAIWEGVPLKFATEHVRALLVYLAVEADVVHPRTTLATLLWPEESETRARHNLRQALFFLKQAFRAYGELDTLLYITPTALQWKNQAIEVDFHAFQRSWKYSQSHGHANLQRCATCLEHFSRALALYQGEFLQGLSLKENQPFEEWALLLREQCHRQAMAMLGSLVAHHLDAGAYEQAAHHATRQVTLEPWYEEGHRHLMQAMAAQGQKSAALRQYEHCRHLLQQELGVPPASETTKLYDQIRTGQFDHLIRSPSHLITPSPLHNIPGTLPPLVGRSQHLEQLRSLLSNPTQRLLTITGMGGMGKSRLALGLLEQLVGESPALFAHGVWFVPTVAISPTVENLTDGLVGAAFKALGVVTPNQAVLSNALFQYLAQRQLLLVFDSFEHLLVEERAATAATEFILALLQAAPDVKVIVTSRQPLQLLVETVIRLEGLLIPSASTPKLDKRDAVNYESIRLFLYHVQRILPGFALRDDNLHAMIDLCHALGGMPLAIELAAALTPHFTLAELVVALRHNLDLLVSQRRDLDARHRHFGAVLESSWQLLSPREQAILAQSSIFVGRFSRVAAQTVTGATVSELAGLVDKSLIQQPGVGVYQLHDLLRQFAADKLHASAQETFAVAERHSAFYLNFVAERERMLTRDQPRQAVEEIQQEVDNVRQAWAWAITQLVQLPSQLPAAEKITATLDACVYALWNFYLIAGLYAEGVTAFQQASAGVQSILNGLSASLATAEGTEVPVRRWQQLLSKLLALGAYIQCTFGSYSDALTTAKQSIAVGVAYGGHAGELIGLLAIALSHYHTGASKEAQTYCTQALQRLQQFAWVNKPPEFYYDVQF
ncbi:MAG: hypothetical protein IT328_27755, partial [Caldilineaceae bacterium]|nr:hypothetical protein [Caldilineaceae bacterium]